MKNISNTIADQVPAAKAISKKTWTAPALDILELESAQHGVHGGKDNFYQHRSG